MTREKRIPVHAMKGGMADIVVNLPTGYYLHIGALITAHAILETQVSELLYDLAAESYPAGRVAFGYKNATDRFQTIINLLDMHGITPTENLKHIKEAISECCNLRDTFAHNIWIRDSNGNIGIRVSKGTLETPEGKINFQFLPMGQHVPYEALEQARSNTLAVVQTVIGLKAEIAELRKQL